MVKLNSKKNKSVGKSIHKHKYWGELIYNTIILNTVGEFGDNHQLSYFYNSRQVYKLIINAFYKKRIIFIRKNKLTYKSFIITEKIHHICRHLYTEVVE